MRLNAENARRTEVLDIGAVRSVRDVAARMRQSRLCVSCPTDEERFAAHADPQLCGECHDRVFGPEAA